MALGQLTFLQLMNAVHRRLGKSQSTVVTGASDTWNGIVTNEINGAQTQIAKEHDWSTLYTSGTFTTSLRTVDLATSFSDFRRAISLVSTTNERVLVPVGHLDIDEYDPGLDDAGSPTAYAIAYPNLLFNRTPSSETFRFRYVRRPTLLVAATDTTILPEDCDMAIVWWVVWQLGSSREDFADGGSNALDTYRTTLAAAIAQDKRRVDRVPVLQPVYGSLRREIVPFPPPYGSEGY